jgi:hypothetical protein
MTVSESVRDYFLQCPLLRDGVFNIEHLGINQVEYTIESVPANPIVTQYIDGTSVRQYVFVFASREFFGADVWENVENNDFYERLCDWIECQNFAGNLPVLSDDMQSESMSVTSSFYVFEQDTNMARYQIQCKLLYLKK